MILRDKRLLACAEMVSGEYICDVGTDHGYLPAHLLAEGKCSKAICADINEMPLDAARATMEKSGIGADRVMFCLSDGLLDVPLDGVTDITIAGMGGELIYRILTDDPRVRTCGADFILQPMTKADELRRDLAAGGFEVISEKGVCEGRFAYCVMKCRYTGKPYEVDPVREYSGLLDGSDTESRQYILRTLDMLTKAANGMKHRDPARSAEITELCGRIRRERLGE